MTFDNEICDGTNINDNIHKGQKLKSLALSDKEKRFSSGGASSKGKHSERKFHTRCSENLTKIIGTKWL